MTKESYDKLSAREKDALCAEHVMKFKNVRLGCSCGYIKAPDYSHGNCCGIPNFSTEIRASWTVVEKFQEKDDVILDYYKSDIDHWRCAFGRGSSFSHAPTSPKAIVEAALRSVGVLE